MISAVHGIRAGCKRFACLSAVRRGTRFLTVNDVRRDRKKAHRGNGVAVRRMAADLLHETLYDIDRDRIGTVIVVAVLRIIPFDAEIGDDAEFVADGIHFRIADRG